MDRLNRYGPSLVLAGVGVLALICGPAMIRTLAYAEQKGRIEESRDRLQSGPLMDLNEAFRSVARAVEPSVVHISVKRKIETLQRRPGEGNDLFRRFQDPNPGEEQSPRRSPQRPGREDYNQYNVPQEVGNGSGWVYEHPGGKKYIVTNNHVVDEADELIVKFHDKTTGRATVVGTDPQTDIAVLEVSNSKPLHPAKLAREKVQQGEIVFAFGSPFQFDFSMSQGIISSDIGRQLGIIGDRNARGRRLAGYENFIQTDAAINPGNSGGPLTNVYGEVVGMNSAIASTTGASNGLGFAIPVDMIRGVANHLIEKGVVRRGYLGVVISDDAELLRNFGYEGKGVLVDDLDQSEKETPAAKAGVKIGDIITEINGQPTQTLADLRRIIASMSPGQSATLKIFREGKEQTFTATLTDQPKELTPITRSKEGSEATPLPPDGGELFRKLGLERITTLTEEIAARVGLGFTPGVLVESVRPQSVADSAGFTRGMVITHVQGQPVTSVGELAEQVGKADLKQGARLRIRAGGVSHFIVLKLPE